MWRAARSQGAHAHWKTEVDHGSTERIPSSHTLPPCQPGSSVTTETTTGRDTRLGKSLLKKEFLREPIDDPGDKIKDTRENGSLTHTQLVQTAYLPVK